jgi:hypothetical protein
MRKIYLVGQKIKTCFPLNKKSNIFKGEKRSVLILMVLALMAVSLLMTGCASSPPQASSMVPKNLTVSKHYRGSVNVKVTCSEFTYRGKNKKAVTISNKDFSSALAETLNQCALFSSVISTNEDYRLNVIVYEVSVPKPGYEMVATILSKWQLIRVLDSAVLANETITTPYSASGLEGHPFALPGNRLRLIVEGAARANITEGIRWLSELNLEM